MIPINMLPPEIWDEICSLIATGSMPGKTLQALALTSHSLHVHSIRQIWHQIPNITPLLHCLPRDLWPPSDEINHRQLWERKLQRNILPEDLKSIEKYANAVRVYGRLHLWARPGVQAPGVGIYQNLQAALALALTGNVLLPNVREAIILNDEPNSFLDLLMGNSLRRLRMVLSNPMIKQFNIPDYPELQELSLVGPYIYMDDIGALSRVLCMSTPRNIRRLEIGRVSWDALEHLGSLPHLQALEVDFTTGNISSGYCTTGFSKLEALYIECHTSSTCVNFLQGLPLALPIKTIRIDVEVFTGSASIANIISSIVACCSHDSLKSIDIDHQERPEEDEDEGNRGFNSQHIEQLLVFKHLQQLKVSLEKEKTFKLDDSIIRQMAIAWPKLANLQLWARVEPDGPKPTLIGLRDLAENCPELSLILMTFDADIIPEGLKELEPTTCKLEEIDVVLSSLNSPEEVSSVLRKIFPSLKRMGSRESREKLGGWKDVMKALGLKHRTFP